MVSDNHSNALSVALAQVEVGSEKLENLNAARRCIAQAAEQGADLMVFPEMFMANPPQGEPLASVAEPLTGPFVSALADMAREYQLAIVCGVWESVPGDAVRAANVAVALDRDGQIKARYNKIHLFDALKVRESDTMTGGNEPPPQFEVNGFTVGLAICYDLRFPELFRFHAENGADLVLVPAAWYAGPLKEDHWLCLLRARAIENTMYVAGADLCGTVFAGRSACFDPFGVPLVDAGDGETLLVFKIARERLQAVRSNLPCLEHRKGTLFAQP